MTWKEQSWSGVFAATLCPFREDQSLDEAGLAEYISDLVAVDNLQGVVCNGHTGEVMSLLPRERAAVTKIVAETVARSTRPVKVCSGVMSEGPLEAVDHAIAAREAGADAILLMPPHHWLRFGPLRLDSDWVLYGGGGYCGDRRDSSSVSRLDQGRVIPLRK